MANSDARFKDIYDSLEKITLRLSRVEECITSPHDCFNRSYFGEMTRALSMPGLRFIGERFQHGIHSYLWLLIHSVALFFSYVYIKEEYDNWQSSPVIRTLSNNLTSVREIPFPAVTICYPYFFKNYDYMEYLHKCMTYNSTAVNYTDCSYNGECDREEMETLSIASGLCAFQAMEGATNAPSKVYSRDINVSMDGKLFATRSQQVLPTCDFVIQQQINKEKDLITGCDTNGFQYFLAYGAYAMCTTANGVRHEDIYKESTVPAIPILPSSNSLRYVGKGLTLADMIYFNGGIDTTPAYFTDDDFFAFYVSKRQNETDKNICNIFKGDDFASVTLHNPAEIPLLQDLEHFVSSNNYHYLKVVPKLVTTKKDLIGYTPLQRGCYYSHERELMMFKFYSESNCDAECIVNCSIKVCNCVPLYLPRPNTLHRVCFSVCDYMGCNCGCLPDCVSLSYDIEYRKETQDTNETGVVFVYYKSSSFYPMIRVGMNDLAGFMAYSFGILGTFNGFSVMVIFELLYFTTFRLWCSIKRYLNEGID